jgi:hypothetical protein
LRSASGALRPFIVVQLLVVMMLAGVGASFALDSNVVVPTATPGPSATPVDENNSLAISGYSLIYNAALTHVTGVTVTVRNKDTAVAHSGIVNVAVDQEEATITGNGSVSNLAAGATVQVTVSLGPILIDTYLQTLRVIVTQTQ